MLNEALNCRDRWLVHRLGPFLQCNSLFFWLPNIRLKKRTIFRWISLKQCCYNQLLLVMADEVGGGKNGSFQNQAPSSSDQRRRATKGADHRYSRQKLRGVTPVLVLWHGGHHRAKLKSTAGGPAVLFVRVQQRNWILLPRICQTCPTLMQERSHFECSTSKCRTECLVVMPRPM